MSTRSSAGWLILLAALAVPGFLFYNWWSRLNAESRRQMTQKVRKRLPDGGVLFSGSPAPNKLTNPIASQGGAGVSSAPPASPSTAAAAADGVNAALASGETAAAGVSALQAAPGASGPPLAAPSAPGEPQPPGSASGGLPSGLVLSRDPTLSPYDIVRIEQIVLEKMIKQQEVKEAVKGQRVKPVKREPPVETTIDLQGIISTSDQGQRAIVNGEMIGEGEFVGQVKVLRITTQGVVFLYKGRRFTKTISK